MKTLMVMAGGTGGHVYPAMAVADELMSRGWQVVWLCTEGGMENRLIANKPYQKTMMTMKGVRGKGLVGWLTLPIKLLTALRQAHQAMQQYMPDLVLGMGGFAAFPGGVMAKFQGLPLVIHEQNSVAGLTNKTLRLIADKTLAAFPSAFGKKATLVGNPVREDISNLASPEARFAGKNGALHILVVGGSLGAQALNEILPKAFDEISKTIAIEVVHQAGEKHIDMLKQQYQHAVYKVAPKAFIDDMAAMYAWADLVICRAGALTIAELSAAGVASILVPFPFAVDDHQTGNARYLSEADAAVLMPQAALTVEKIVEIIKKLTREKCLEMAKKAHQLGKPQATKEVADICEAIALCHQEQTP
jgi:UDP-N-acetylglucosamine--N-acetylmuramyl-(pentapeptide) pyrophosphoryl-undecaprenol N-acetylglucosamine transferase